MFNHEQAQREIDKDIRSLIKVIGGKPTFQMKEYPMLHWGKGSIMMGINVRLDYKDKDHDEMGEAAAAATDWLRKKNYEPSVSYP